MNLQITKSKKMTYREKKEALEGIKRGYFRGADFENIGTMFFVRKDYGSVLRDVVFYGSRRYGLEFEVLMLNSSYFIGSKEHALALQEALGGKAYQTEYCFIAENPRELWGWEGPLRQEQCVRLHNLQEPLLLDIEEMKEILF